ncbi:MAG: RecQ family ATP-dependent DNA helicase [Spirochaetaceae bacterium]|jgi:ATP-dependent DNA helicase RecQ|nr:RecQ family ATP-dependent DNA helicase [Spirochaetaceae bacterium]
MEITDSGMTGAFGDPIQAAVKKLFGLNYLFPYQRLVVGNIIEAAEASGIKIRWNIVYAESGGLFDGYVADSCASPDSPNSYEDDAPSSDGVQQVFSDRASLGRQIVILPTGAGKSLCFQLPAMLLDGPTLVIYPILSLMADQERRLLEKDFAPVILRGGQSVEERAAIMEKITSGESRFIIANPEVLLTEKLLRLLPEMGIVHVVIDEAHCVSEWGESFRPSYLEIGKIIEASAAPLVTAFTATASAPVLEKISRYIFGGAGAHQIVGNPDRSNIAYAARGAILRDLAVRDIIAANERPAIVFCSSRHGTENLARYLRNSLQSGEIRFYHAGLERPEKTDVEKWFFSSAEGVLVATCAYGMGVDKANIRTVIHRDCPPSVEAYLQESGRAGRDGALSRAFLLWGPDDESALRRAKTDADKRRLADLFEYARDSVNCRRERLLNLLNYEGGGEKPETECCDVCAKNANSALREEAAISGFFRRNKRSYTLDEASNVLAKAAEAKNNYRLSPWSPAEAKRAVSVLLDMGRLKRMRFFPWKNKIC